MASTRGKKWSREEVKLLRQLVKRGLPFSLMLINGRSAHAIKVKAESLGITSETQWSSREVEALEKALDRGVPTSQIRINKRFSRDQRPKNSVRVKARRLGLVETNPPRQHWSELEIELLKYLVARGFSIKKIKEEGFFGPGRIDEGNRQLPARSCNALAKMAQRLNLADHNRSQTASVAKRVFTKEFCSRLDDFILSSHKVLNSEDIAEIFPVSPSTIRRRRARLLAR